MYADVTFGGGGHSRAIVDRLSSAGHLYGFDQDADAEGNALVGDSRFTFVRSNFRYLKNWMRYYGVEHLDGVLADLGVSSHHLDEAARGFAFRHDAPLDMRMNTRGGVSAADLVATASDDALTRILADYGELRQARRMAVAITERRESRPIMTTGDLVETVRPLISPKAEKKELAQVFQALRIEVNHEMQALEEMLLAATQLLVPGGRLVVMSYHSLEDRIVKNIIRSGRVDGVVEKDFYGRPLSPLQAVGKVAVAPQDEVEANPRARSAKLRIAQRVVVEDVDD